MTTEKWGPVTWTLIHILVQRVHSHQTSLFELFDLITSIVSNLPCPLCSDDSKKFLSKINKSGIKEPQHLQDIFFLFHNLVNKKKNKPLFDKHNLDKYKYIFIIPVYKQFIQVYNTNGNMKLLQDNMQRNIVKKNLNLYIKKYIPLFIKPYPNLSQTNKSEKSDDCNKDEDDKDKNDFHEYVNKNNQNEYDEDDKEKNEYDEDDEDDNKDNQNEYDEDDYIHS